MTDRFFSVLGIFYSNGFVLGDEEEFALDVVLEKVPSKDHFMFVEKIVNLASYSYESAMKALRDLKDQEVIDINSIDEQVLKFRRQGSDEHELPKTIYNQ